ncbi:MAG: right-handed parallel beta-helix repeat-containing protein [Sedimentisphaerales bacterium]
MAAWILDGVESATHNPYFNIVMNGPHTVTVRFESHIPGNLIVPDEYATIQEAIDAAINGDTIYIYRKVSGLPHYITDPNGFDFKGKAITIRSEDPNDPNIVAATVIDCCSLGRAFIFQNGEDANSIIEGLTIINSLSAGAIAVGVRPDPIDPNRLSGIDATGNGFGGAIFIGRNTSPTIRYCVFSNCEVAGGIGSDGADGYDLFLNDPRDSGGGGGNGGNGYGNGYGGAIFCDQNSSPTILSCTISNSIAQGGIGGNGGTGGDGTSSKIGGDGGNGGNGSGRGYGGAIYVAANAKPKIVRCSFIENIASMGLGGQGGRQGAGQYKDSPPFAQDGYDGSSSGAGISGAIYYEKGTTVDINDCNFINNTIEADTTGIYDTDGGAIYCEPNCAGISILKTNLTGNKATGGNGGAIKFGPKNNIKLADCYFGGNIANGNGGALMIGTLNDTNICRLNVNNCAFTDNISGGTGGAIMAANFDANFIDCYINRNTAQTGGGLYFTSNVSTVRIHGGTIMQNKAIGANAEGGGAYISNMPLEIVNCQIIGNSSPYSGGGIMFKGPGTTTSKIHNCLFVSNSANARGGAIYISLSSSPKITSCTFSENGCEPGGAGGAIFFAYNCSPTIKDCIFDNTRRVAIYANSADCDPNISYCLFNKNTAGDFYDYQTGITYDTNRPGDANVNLTALNHINIIDGNNIAGNPIFLKSDLGNYYLSQIPPNASQSPAIDYGSSLAVDVNVLPNDNMADYTTRTDSNNLVSSQGDTGQLDIGFHYIDIEPNRPRRFNLTTTAADSHGNIEPPGGQYYAGTTIELTALPNTGWRVNKWTGTDNDSSTNTKNYVVMIRNRDVAVSFEQPKNLYVPGQYSSPQEAINHAKNGDRVIIAKGTYYGAETNYDYSRIPIFGRGFTITGTNPDDPCVVAQTILQNNGFWLANVDSNMVLDGITIQDTEGYAGWIDCGLAGAHGPSGDGWNGNSIFGGAIQLYNASPIIRNCRFVRCSALASNGCSGSGEYGDGGWAGFAWGGAVGVDSTSNPIFKNCQFIDCYAQGSNGQDGSGKYGHGGNWGDPNGSNIYISQQWDFSPDFGHSPYEDPSYYSGYGGAVYCMGGSKTEFEDCLFQGNRAYGGVSGVSGSVRIFGYPYEHYAIDSFGGAIYLAAGSEAKFTDCNFVNNEAHTRGQIAGSDPNVPNIGRAGLRYDVTIANTSLYDPVISYGGAICTEGTIMPVLKNCTFTNNRACAGGGMYWENSIAHISRSTFENCIAMLGGAVLLIDSNSIIYECNFSGNEANNPAGQGGAIYSASSDAKFYDCQFNNNNADTSGGAAYFTGELEPNMHNCLITYNNAGRDGGGVSANWDTQLSLSNCTFSQNEATGIGFMASYGGGLSCAYQANTKIINSIFWNNRAYYGPEISIGSNFDAADKQTAEVTISYSNVKGGAANIFVDTGANCVLNWDYASNFSGTSAESPLFVTGDWGSFYLSQTIPSAPNDVNSFCVDAGFDTAINNDMYRHTTRKDNVIDIADSNVDMGYHYTLTAEILGDFNFDGIVDITDAALFYEYWMNTGCDFPYFCHERDITGDGEVDFEDFAAFAENYGLTETTPPRPNPMTWALKPRSETATSIKMTATTARDNSGSQVHYYFTETTGHPGASDSGWITSRDYNDTGLSTGTQYGYKVKARDARLNETEWSVIGYAVAGEDDIPPQPDPMTWATAPYATSPNSIRMIATSATDACAIEYFFDCYSGNCHDSNWQNTTLYVDTGLEPDTTYAYRVQARDKSPAQNTTQFSEPNWATTLAEGQDTNDVNDINDTTPPTYTPTANGLWAQVPQAYYDGSTHLWYHTMTAVAATDTSLPLTYFFKCVSGSGSDWTTTTLGGVEVTYINGGWTGANPATYRVRITDAAGNYVQSTTLETIIP